MDALEEDYLDGVSSGEEGDNGEFYDDAYFETDEEDAQVEGSKDASTGKAAPRKRVPKVTDEELLYDPNEDDKDEAWVLKKFGGGIAGVSSETDAVLNCPCCMTLLCLRCQKHDSFKTQYRAVFVANCLTDKSERLRMRPDENAPEELFHPVRCNVCKTEVGVIDVDEIYHFFHVLASEP